jgi:hypothetical protein
LELDASYNCGIGSGALPDCRRLQVLNADWNTKITTLQPFAQRLRELRAGNQGAECDCALDDAALADATGLVSLSADFNEAITTVEPFGASLRRLDACESLIVQATAVNEPCVLECIGQQQRCIPFLNRLKFGYTSSFVCGEVCEQIKASHDSHEKQIKHPK